MEKIARMSMAAVLRKLEGLYDPPRTFLRWRTPLDLLVATILSAQCTDDRVNIVTQALFKKHRKPEDYVKTSQRQLERAIHSCGTFRVKARYIRTLSRILLRKHNGKVPESMEELLELPGVGRKTAVIVLHAAFEKEEGIAVDTHVQRLARRLGLTRKKTPEKIELDLIRQTPRAKWGRLNTLLISHGRAVCTARNRQCAACAFKDACPSSLAHGRRDLAQPK
jgi:endonuclease-3